MKITSLLLLATEKKFYTHGFEVILIIAVIFTLLGLLIGRAIWGHCRAEAMRIEKLNAHLEKKQEKIKSEQDQLERLLKKLPKDSATAH